MGTSAIRLQRTGLGYALHWPAALLLEPLGTVRYGRRKSTPAFVLGFWEAEWDGVSYRGWRRKPLERRVLQIALGGA